MSKEKNVAVKNAERVNRMKQEDLLWNRILIWLGVCALIEIVLLWMAPFMVVKSTAESALLFTIGLRKVVSVARWVALAVAVAGGIWAVVRKKAGQEISRQVVMVCCGLGAGVGLQVMHSFRENGTHFVCRAVLGVAVLGLIHFLYQRAFLLASTLSGVGILGLWLVRETDGVQHSLVRLGLIGGVVLAVVLAVLTWMAQAKGGTLKSIRIFANKEESTLLYLTAVIVAVSLVATLLLGAASVAYYLLFVLVAWVFVMAVYFTVKQM